MIFDLLSNATLYDGVHALFPQAFAYLRSFDPATPTGKYALQGETLVASVERYISRDPADKEWEAHNVYGDIQAVITGEESCGYSERARLQSLKAYNPSKDVEKFSTPGFTSSSLILTPGTFAIFFPQDAHQPSIRVQGSSPVLKVVIKFKLASF